MLKKRTIRYLRKKCLDLSGKVFVVTGSSSGIGFKEAEELVFLHAAVILACRNREKAEKAKAMLLEDYPDASVDVFDLNLASFSSIINFVNKISGKIAKIDGFINNAGVFNVPHQKTENGFELVLGTNYIGTYFLTKRLLPLLEKSGKEVKFVNTVSITYKRSRIHFDDFFFDRHYNCFKVYGESKLCLLKYTLYLSMNNSGSNVRFYMSHPGISMTSLAKNGFGRVIRGLATAFSFCFNSPEKSALAVPLIMSGKAEPGTLTGPHALFDGWGYPKKNRIKRKAFSDWERLIDFTDDLISKAQ